MFHLEKILVPIDFSENSLAAAGSAASLARRFHSEITLLHVNEFAPQALSGPLGYGITSSEAERAAYLTRRRKDLEEFGAAELGEVPVKRFVCCGDPAAVIVNCARDWKSDLIVMPTRGHGKFRRFLLGSVTAKVLHDVECPVWTGAHLATPATAPLDIRRVMCAVDLGQQSSSAIRWAAALAKQLGAGLTVMHAVLETPPNLPDRYVFQWHEEAQWGTEQRLHTLLSDTNVEAECMVVSDGDIVRAIAGAVKEKEAGLLVIARGCVGRIPKRLGSRTYAIVCETPCAVVSV